MSITVTDALDNSTHEFPDGTSPDIIKGAMARYRSQSQKPVSTPQENLGVADVAKQAFAGQYLGKRPQDVPGFWSTLIGGPTEALKFLGSETKNILTPPFMRPEEKKYGSPGLEPLKLFSLIPSVDLSQAIGAGVGKQAYKMTGNPYVGAGADIVANLASPRLLSKLGEIPSVANKLKFRETPPITPMPKAEEIERVGKEVAPGETTAEQFGEKFKYPLYPEKGEQGGYYREAQRAGQEEASTKYAQPTTLAQGVNVEGSQVANALRDFAKEQGISVKVAPTRAERFAEKAAQVIDPIAEEQNAFQRVKNMTALELQQGISGTSRWSDKDLMRFLLKRADDPRAQEIMGQMGDITLDKQMSLTDLIGLRQRLNGARRASQGNDALFHQFNEMRNRVDDIIAKASPQARQALRDADVWYASEYLPSFGRQGALRKMTDQDAGLIVDELMPKGKGYEIAERQIRKLNPEAQGALRSAWVNNLFNASKDNITGEMKPGELFKQYNQYNERSKWALLGGKKPQMDDLMRTIQQAEKDTLKRKVGHLATYGGNMMGGMLAIFALKDVIEYQMTGNKRLLGYAGADLAKAGALFAFSRPQVLSRLIATKNGGINALKSFVKVPANDPNFGPTAVNLMSMLSEVNKELEAERGEQPEQNQAGR